MSVWCHVLWTVQSMPVWRRVYFARELFRFFSCFSLIFALHPPPSPTHTYTHTRWARIPEVQVQSRQGEWALFSLTPSALSFEFVFLWHASSDSAEVLADVWRRGPAERSWSVSCIIASRWSWRVSVWSVCFDWREAGLPSWCNRKHNGRASQRYRLESRREMGTFFLLTISSTHTHTLLSWGGGGGGGGFRTKPRIGIEFVWTHAHCNHVEVVWRPRGQWWDVMCERVRAALIVIVGQVCRCRMPSFETLVTVCSLKKRVHKSFRAQNKLNKIDHLL